MTDINTAGKPSFVASLIQLNDKVGERNPGCDLAPTLATLVTEPLEDPAEALALCGGLKVTPYMNGDVPFELDEDDVPPPSAFEGQVLLHMGDSVRLFKKWELSGIEYLVVSHSWEMFQTLTYGDFEKIAELARRERSRPSDPNDWNDHHFDEKRLGNLEEAIAALGSKLEYGMVSVREFLVKAA